MDEKTLEKLKADFNGVSQKALAVLLYGSHAKHEQTQRSDIDVCIVAPDRDAKELYKETLALADYDVKIFETLPLYLKMAVIESHKIIYCADEAALYEYFYQFRREWGDQAHRQEISGEELLEMLS